MQPDLFSYVPPQILGDRDGATFEPKRDGARLNKQAQDIFNFMSNGVSPAVSWYTLKQISHYTGHPEASVSARLRDLRKPKFGGFTVERRHLSKGLWQYRLIA